MRISDALTLDGLQLINIYLQMVLIEIQYVAFITLTLPESSSLPITLPGTSLLGPIPSLRGEEKKKT
jgi:hypothetical protein